MASAIFGGIANAKLVNAQDVIVYDPLPEKWEAAQRLGFRVAAQNDDVVKNADMIFLCVKPKDFPALLPQISPHLGSNKVVVSIAAGISTTFITNVLGKVVPVIRAMPNTPLLLGQGTTALCHNTAANIEQIAFVKNVFSKAGTVYELQESQFDDVINLNGSSPAYIYLIADTIAHYASQQGGIPYETSLAMICDTLHGAAAMMQKSGKSTHELIEAVSSPGGTTVAALQAFRATGLPESLRAGCAACVERAQEMAVELEQK